MKRKNRVYDVVSSLFKQDQSTAKTFYNIKDAVNYAHELADKMDFNRDNWKKVIMPHMPQSKYFLVNQLTNFFVVVSERIRQ